MFFKKYSITLFFFLKKLLYWFKEFKFYVSSELFNTANLFLEAF